MLANPRLKINALLNLRICDIHEEMLQDRLLQEAWKVLFQTKEKNEYKELVFQKGHKKGHPLERSAVRYVIDCCLEEADIEDKIGWPALREYYRVVKNEV